MSERVGILLMAYGTPASAGDVEPYYTHIRGGRPPSPQALEGLAARYRAIGGASPLLDVCREQAAGLEGLLGSGFQVELGMKHSPPFIEDGVEALAAAGVRRAVALALAPHYSELSVAQYMSRARAATADRFELAEVEHWHLTPSYLALLAERVRECLGSFPERDRAEVDLVVTAHSLPARIAENGDPYPAQLRETAEAVALRCEIERWSIAWQSASATPEPWLGPDVRDVVRGLAKSGSRGVIVCPAGFVSDHLEILYDLDVDCRGVAMRAGIPWRRTASPNADPELLEALGEVVLGRLGVAA